MATMKYSSSSHSSKMWSDKPVEDEALVRPAATSRAPRTHARRACCAADGVARAGAAQEAGSPSAAKFNDALVDWLNSPDNNSDSQTCASSPCAQQQLFACGFHGDVVDDRTACMALTALAMLLVRSDEATLDDVEIDEQGKLDLSGNAVDRYARAVRLLRPSPPRPAAFPAAALGLPRSCC